MQSILEALMPLSDRVTVRRNIDRAVMAFESLDFFWRDREHRLVVHVVAPDPEFRHIADRVTEVAGKFDNIAIKLWRESDISPVFGEVEGKGIAKQMLIKLAAFTFIRSRFFLTLDSDIVACRPMTVNDLIKAGLALNDWVVPSSPGWHVNSGKILHLQVQLDKPRMFVTPQILSTDICKRLAVFLTDRFDGEDWMYGLIGRYTEPDIWTEYAMYDTFAESHELIGKYHQPCGDDKLQAIASGIWYAHQFADWQPELAINGAQKGYFLVLQSITASQLDFDLVRSRWIEAVARTYPNYPSA